jgi:nucleotidyltransferase/DNA polymerase involved in DNA repair
MVEPENVILNGVQKRKDPNISSLSPSTLKKRRVLEERSQNIAATPVQKSRVMKGSSQPAKSSFEEDLNRLTQEIGEVGNCNHSRFLYSADRCSSI